MSRSSSPRRKPIPGPALYVEPLRVSMVFGAHLLGISKSTLYKLVRANKIKPVKEGAHSLLTMAELRRYSASTDPAQESVS